MAKISKSDKIVKFITLVVYHLLVLSVAITIIEFLPISKIWFLAIYAVLLLFAICIPFWSEDGKGGKFLSILWPKFGKEIYHRSGTYYLRYECNRYTLYRNCFFGLSEMNSWYENDILSSVDLSSIIKAYLDIRYKQQIEQIELKKSKMDIMQSWDGYVDISEKRNDILGSLDI